MHRNLERSERKKCPRIQKTDPGGLGGRAYQGFGTQLRLLLGKASVQAHCCVTEQVTSLPWGLIFPPVR